jgi:hypothetical protein
MIMKTKKPARLRVVDISTEERDGGLLFVGSLWERTSKNGIVYFSGKTTALDILIFPNGNRRSERSPTHQLFFKNREENDTKQ